MSNRPKSRRKSIRNCRPTQVIPFDGGDSIAFAWKRAQNNPAYLNDFYRLLLKSDVHVPVLPDKYPPDEPADCCSSNVMMMQDNSSGEIKMPFFTSQAAAAIGGNEIAQAAKMAQVIFLVDNTRNFFTQALRLGHPAQMNRNGVNPKIFSLEEMESLLRLEDVCPILNPILGSEVEEMKPCPKPEKEEAPPKKVAAKVKKDAEGPQPLKASAKKLKALRKLLAQAEKELELKDRQIKNERQQSRDELDKRDKKVDLLSYRIDQYKGLEERLKAKIRAKTARREHYFEARLERLKADLEAAENQLATIKRPWNWPDTLEDVLSLGLDYYGDRLVFHDDLILTDPYAKDARIVRDAWNMIKALGNSLHRMKFVDGLFTEKLFTDETGIEIAMTEGKETKKNRIFERPRTFTYRGQEITSYAHLKGSGDFRLYFHILEDERRIIIYHIGEHLPNSQTKNYKKSA